MTVKNTAEQDRKELIQAAAKHAREAHNIIKGDLQFTDSYSNRAIAHALTSIALLLPDALDSLAGIDHSIKDFINSTHVIDVLPR